MKLSGSLQEASDQMGRILAHLLSVDHFILPIRFAIVSSNGVVVAGEHIDGDDGYLETTFLVEYFPEGTQLMDTPINIMFTDSTGNKAARVKLGTVEDEGGENFTIH